MYILQRGLHFTWHNLPVNGDGAGQVEDDGVAGAACTAHPVGGRRSVDITAVGQQAAGWVGCAVLVHCGCYCSRSTTH